MIKIAVISHDAGGAEILSHWLKRQDYIFSTVLKGPAINVFKNNNIQASNNNLFEAINDANFVITGTSWQSDLEKEAIYLAKKMGIYTISFLDHWVNYEERFIYNNKLILPDEIWVTDKFAFDLAKNIFKKTTIKRKNNYYLINMKKIIEKKFLKNKTRNQNYKGLFIGENISEHALLNTGKIDGFGFNEQDSLKYLLDNIHNLKIKVSNLKIRPHPSDIKDKYNWTRKNKIVTEISNNNSLVDDILESNIIFGCESFAMVIGLLANKKVISCIPKSEKKCSLPYPKIIPLRDIIV